MVNLLIVLILIVCIALGFFVLIQNPKGGGLVSGGASSNMFGVQRTGDVLEKGTWVLMTLLVVFTLGVTVLTKNGGSSSSIGSKIDSHINKSASPSPIGGNTLDKGAQPAAAPATADSSKK